MKLTSFEFINSSYCHLSLSLHFILVIIYLPANLLSSLLMFYEYRSISEKTYPFAESWYIFFDLFIDGFTHLLAPAFEGGIDGLPYYVYLLKDLPIF